MIVRMSSVATTAMPADARPTPLPSTVPNGGRCADVARTLDHWRARNAFYHQRKAEYLRFIVPRGESVLLIGCEDGRLLAEMEPSRGVGVDASPAMVDLARRRHGAFRYATDIVTGARAGETFEYVVINDVAGEERDLFTLLQTIADRCTDSSRLIVLQHNYLWRPALNLAAWLGLKRPETRQNWLSVGDLRVFLAGAGFETVDVESKLYCPKRLLGLGVLINWCAGLLPFVHRLASTEILVARKITCDANAAVKTASVVLTVRDECDNIEPMVRAIPKVGAGHEIIFVEGHSTDGTREEIERVIRAYPNLDIRLLVQDGVGQGDAIRLGFREARGDVIILLEADQTSPAEDVCKAFDIIAYRRADYVNGSRFIYPRDKGSMALPNVLGNWLFAIWFTWFLGQRTSDVLCGLKAIDRRQFARLEPNWGFLGLFDPFGDFELLFGAARLGLKICEVPTRYKCRRYGVTKSRVLTHGMMLARMAARATRAFQCR